MRQKDSNGSNFFLFFFHGNAAILEFTFLYARVFICSTFFLKTQHTAALPFALFISLPNFAVARSEPISLFVLYRERS